MGTVVGFGEEGKCHLGDITFNTDNGKVYVSMIASVVYGSATEDNSRERNCYVVIIEPEKIMKIGHLADEVCSVVYVGEPIVALASEKAGDWDLRLGGKYGVKNGVDSCTFGPRFGKKNGKNYLTMIPSTASSAQETDGKNMFDRPDADYFTVLQFDVGDWEKYEKPYGEIARAQGPSAADGTYFYYAGFHDYGVQNLCYDSYKNIYFATAYATDYANPKRSKFPDFMFFAIDASHAEERTLTGCGGEKGKVLRSKYGIKDASGVTGYDLSASVGILSLGDGRYYVASVKKGGADMTLYSWSKDTTDCCIEEV